MINSTDIKKISIYFGYKYNTWPNTNKDIILSSRHMENHSPLSSLCLYYNNRLLMKNNAYRTIDHSFLLIPIWRYSRSIGYDHYDQKSMEVQCERDTHENKVLNRGVIKNMKLGNLLTSVEWPFPPFSNPHSILSFWNQYEHDQEGEEKVWTTNVLELEIFKMEPLFQPIFLLQKIEEGQVA